jgi:hypothetical protein
MPGYRPFLVGPTRLQMGIKALDLRDWIELGPDTPAQMAERRRLLAGRRADVLDALPGSEAAQGELLGCLIEHLLDRFPQRFHREGDALREPWTGTAQPVGPGGEPLATVGRLVPEDVCLLQAGPDGYRLVAAVLCFPSRWRLADKLGRSLDLIHEPVPGFQAELAPTVNRFFAGIRVERPVWRLNWSLHDTDALFLPTREHPPEPVFAEGRGWYLRVERQTLRRLPASGVVVFTIRTHLEPLTDAVGEPGAAEALAARVRELPAAMLAYKGLSLVRTPLLAWLDQVAASGGGSAPIGLPTVSNGPSRPRSSSARASTQ